MLGGGREWIAKQHDKIAQDVKKKKKKANF